MFFVSKKKYNTLLKQKEDYQRIAEKAVAQNGRLLDEWEEANKEIKSIQELNHKLVERNEELVARCKKLEQERYMWRKCAEEWSAQAEIYRKILKSAEVEW